MLSLKEKSKDVKTIIVDIGIKVGYISRGLNRKNRVSLELKAQYDALIASGDVFHDDAQIDAIRILEEIRANLEASSQRPSNLIRRLLKRSDGLPPPGLYLWGGVGAGKSMLMDLFFAATRIDRKRRVHFHAFMQEIHEAIHAARKTGHPDPIDAVAADVASGARLLCFDEVQITDITDAMIVGRLFEKLFEVGTTIVTTSNRVPDDLYKNGLNRQLFLPFIRLITEKVTVHHLFTDMDYRQDRLRGEQTWFSPLGEDSRKELDRIWCSLTDEEGSALTLRVKLRSVTLPIFHNGTARVGFSDLCEKPLGAADYLAIADAVRVLIIDDVPQMSRARNNEAKRFMTLIDTLYEAKTQLICTAETEPEQLYEQGAGAFEFERTSSRLREMQSVDWGRVD